MGSTAATGNDPPDPSGIRSYDDLTARLRDLRTWSGLSYRELHRRVVALRRTAGVAEIPSVDTVHRCLRPGRRRIDLELAVDIARALLGEDRDATPWRQACAAASGHTTEAAVVSVADTLPEELDDFVGREQHLAALMTLITSGDGDRSVLVSMDGMPGVGKTSLAARAGRLIADRLRCDIVLWVNLRGHDPNRPPADPAAVLDGFLRRLGVSGSRTAGLDLERRAERYRALTRSRRPLVILDDAASEQQARPLLPDSPGSVTLLTSRAHLTGLDPHRLAVASFDSGESLTLLDRVIGGGRVAAEPTSAAAIVDMVGHLPLAIGIEGARIREGDDWSLADHQARLEDRHARLLLNAGVELAVASSYDALPDAARRMFRLIALHPGDDFDGYAAAALAGVDRPAASGTLRTLVEANLLERRPGDRYLLHDLVRLFAANKAADHEPRTGRQEALARLYEYYRYTAMLAMDQYAPDVTQRPRFPDPEIPTPSLPEHSVAREWLDAERSNLVAIAADAAAGGSSTLPVDLSETLYRYFDFAALHTEARTLHEIACSSTRGPRRGNALRFLGSTKEELGSYQEALALFRQAAAIHREARDVASEASALCNSGITSFKIGRGRDAVRLLEQARDLYRETENQAGEAVVLVNLGTIYSKWDRAVDALECCRQALRLAHELGFRGMEAFVLGTVGSVHASSGEHTEALEHYRRALDIADELGTHTLVGTMNNKIGLSHHARGDPDAASPFFQNALAIARETGELREQAEAHDGLADCEQEFGQVETAREHRQQAHAIREELGIAGPPGDGHPGGRTSQ